MLTLAILAGGQSNRMGQDKALIPFLGRPLISRVLDRLASLAQESIIIISGGAEAYTKFGVKVIKDLLPGRGALGGLYTAISEATHPAVAVAACDLPFASAALFTHEYDLLNSEKVDIVIPQTIKGTEPLHAVYRCATCLPAIRAALDANEQRLISWFPGLRVRYLSPVEIQIDDHQGLAFWNLNSPEEFQMAEKHAREKVDGDRIG